jgi:hypothetical protein
MTQVTPASIAYIATQASFAFVSMVVCLPLSFLRFDLPYRHRLFFPGRIPLQIRIHSTTRCLAYSKMKKRKTKSASYFCGGTSTYIFTFHAAASKPPFCCRQVFSSRLSARQPIRKNSALARIKQRRSEINGADLAREA